MVLDARFAVIASVSLDGAYTSVFNVARAKAKTALNFGAATADLAVKVKPESQAALLAVEPGMMFIGGGVPIRRGGELIGAIGVSGGSAEQDSECAQHALDAVDWEQG